MWFGPGVVEVDLGVARGLREGGRGWMSDVAAKSRDGTLSKVRSVMIRCGTVSFGFIRLGFGLGLCQKSTDRFSSCLVAANIHGRMH